MHDKDLPQDDRKSALEVMCQSLKNLCAEGDQCVDLDGVRTIEEERCG